MTLENTVTVSEISRITGKSVKTIHRDISAGKLPIVYRAPGKTGTVLADLEVVRNVYKQAETAE